MKASKSDPSSASNARHKHNPVRHAGSGRVRIIGGKYRRSWLAVLDSPGLRPTPDRVRQTLFDWLGQDLTGWTCVDAFAGSGVLGFEAASRGASSVVLMEKNPVLSAQLSRNRARLQIDNLQIQTGDALVLLSRLSAGFADLVFLDPPFDSNEWAPTLTAALRCCRVGAWIYLESAKAWSEDDLRPWSLRLHRHMQAGAVHAHLLQMANF